MLEPQRRDSAATHRELQAAEHLRRISLRQPRRAVQEQLPQYNTTYTRHKSDVRIVMVENSFCLSSSLGYLGVIERVDKHNESSSVRFGFNGHLSNSA